MPLWPGSARPVAAATSDKTEAQLVARRGATDWGLLLWTEPALQRLNEAFADPHERVGWSEIEFAFSGVCGGKQRLRICPCCVVGIFALRHLDIYVAP